MRSTTSRREFLQSAGGGTGSLALALLLSSEGLLAGDPAGGHSSEGHFRPRARRVIHLFMHGGPSHVDLFDPKPALSKYAGQPLPPSFGEVMTRRKVARNPLLPPVRPFARYGESGLPVSGFLPHMARHADKLAVLRSCHGDSVNHPQSVYQMNTGSVLMGKPSLGSWLSYGLGSENGDMPSYVVMADPGGAPKGGPPAWGAGFLPAAHQGTLVRAGPNPILNLRPPAGISQEEQRRLLDLTLRLGRRGLERQGSNSELEARIRSYELAYRMQTAAPEIVDIAGESAATKKLYGLDDDATREFGTRCLLARRMIERGVRFVQLYSGDTGGWDAHKDVEKNHGLYGRRTDLPIAGLLTDLESRGLLDDTLVFWGGEFGRMPMSEQGTGRDHNPWGYSVWLAGAGVKGGVAYGATDDVGLRAAENPVHVHDLHATILHLLGIDHERLTFRHHGRDERLTDVAGRVIHEVIA